MSSVSNATNMAQVQLTVAKMQLDSMEQQGRDAVSLIKSAAASPASVTPANTAPGVGMNVNYSA
jgi:hypothetical protein